MRKTTIFILLFILSVLAYQLNDYFTYLKKSEQNQLNLQEKPSIGLIQGHGEPSLADLQKVHQFLAPRYNLENIYLDTEAAIPKRFKGILLVGPKEKIPLVDLNKLTDYFQQGGNLIMAINQVEGNLQSLKGQVLETGLVSWLLGIGIQMNPNFLVDKDCKDVPLPHFENGVLVHTPIPFPFVPIFRNFSSHPISKDLGPIMMPFCSAIKYVGDATATFTPLVFSSEKTALIAPPVYFDTAKKWLDSDFSNANLVVGAILDNSTYNGQLILFGDGDFPVTGQLGQADSDNIRLLVNSVDWIVGNNTQ